MVICFSTTESAKKALDEIMATGQFKDVSEAISVALVNYRVIQHEVGHGGHTVIGTKPTASPEIDLEKLWPAQSKTTSPRSTAIPPIFTRRISNLEGISFIPTPEIPSGDGLSYAPNLWLWGQYNRFLPVKATCRALASLMEEHRQGVPMEEASSKISFAACGLGDFLSGLDSRLLRRREEAMAAAFPNSAITGAQGRARFSAQFVGAIKQGKLIGLPAGLRLLGIDSTKEPRLFLTKEAAEFAALENPVLDGGGELATRTLSEEETHFLLGHIKHFVPEEFSAYAAIVDSIESGADAPDDVDTFLRQRFNLEDDSKMTASFLATQRTGAVSRMVELGLIARKKTDYASRTSSLNQENRLRINRTTNRNQNYARPDIT